MNAFGLGVGIVLLMGLAEVPIVVHVMRSAEGTQVAKTAVNAPTSWGHQRGSVVSVRHKAPTLGDLQAGRANASIFFTAHGEAFLWPWTEQSGCDVAWKVDGKWHGHLVCPVDYASITGYPTIPDDAEGVILE